MPTSSTALTPFENLLPVFAKSNPVPIPTGAATDIVVNLGRTFPTAPICVPSIVSISTDILKCTVINQTTTTCTVRVHNSHASFVATGVIINVVAGLP